MLKIPRVKIRQRHFAVAALLILGVVAVALVLIVHGHNMGILDPKGEVAMRQRRLIIFGTLLSLLVVVPVYAMTFFIAWKYRASNHKAKYAPEFDRSRAAESTWWGVPMALILVLSVVTYVSSHALDPGKALASNKKPLTIQVVALPWKWLFIYPQQNIATVNFVEFPKGTPITFDITSDAPMNSFWIPQLGGQIYAMSGMSTQLHLMANTAGDYKGSSANISGQGFAGMKFTARAAASDSDFSQWVSTVKTSPLALNESVYAQLALPSENVPLKMYASTEPGLYETVIMKYMMPGMDIPITADANGGTD